ncbi:MAG: radical SAM protein [Candidatus Omnitrophota bacterium]
MSSKKIKKVMLLTPPAFTSRDATDINPIPPLGLGYLGAVLEERGIEVKIFDSLIEGFHNRTHIDKDTVRIGAPFAMIEDEIKRFSPDILGVSNLFSRQSENAHEIYRLAKKIDSRMVVIAGGAHPSVLPEAVMEDRNVDFVVIGEGEYTLKTLIDCLENGATFDKLDGIAFRENGKIKVCPKKYFIEDLDSLPFPAWHLLGITKYFGLSSSHGSRRCEKFSPIVTSRGCPIGCAFCTAHHVWGKNFRKRSPENVIKEMKELKDKYDIEELLFEDDNVTLDVKRGERIFDLMIEERLNLKWDTPNGVAAFALDEALIKKMKDSGCYKLNIAVESGNKDVLKNIIKKPLDLEKVKRLIKYARSIGLQTGIFLIIGMPGETLDQIWDSYRFAREVKIYDAFVSVATPYPGSELYKICTENKYVDAERLLENLYISSFSVSTENWTRDDLRRTFKRGYYYLKMHFYKTHPLLFLRRLAKRIFLFPITKVFR